MHKFTDNKGRVWNVELNGFTLRRVKEECGVYLTDLSDMSGSPDSLAGKLFAPPFELLVQVMWAMCEKQADSDGIPPDDFGEGLAGPSLSDAAEALSATVADFFISQEQRETMTALMKKSQQTARLIQGRARDAIESLDPELVARSFIESSSNPAADVELAQTSES